MNVLEDIYDYEPVREKFSPNPLLFQRPNGRKIRHISVFVFSIWFGLKKSVFAWAIPCVS